MRTGLRNLIVYCEVPTIRSELLQMAYSDLSAATAAGVLAKAIAGAPEFVRQLGDMAPGRRGMQVSGWLLRNQILGATSAPIDVSLGIQALRAIGAEAQRQKVQIDDLYIDNEVDASPPGPPSNENFLLAKAWKLDAFQRCCVQSGALAVRPEPHLGKVYPCVFNYQITCGARPMPSIFTDPFGGNPTGDMNVYTNAIDGRTSSIWANLSAAGNSTTPVSRYQGYHRHWAWNAVIDLANYICSAHAGGYTVVLNPSWPDRNKHDAHNIPSLSGGQLDIATSRRQWAVAMNVAADLGVRKWVLFNDYGVGTPPRNNAALHNEQDAISADIFADIDRRIGGGAPVRLDIGDTPLDSATIRIGSRVYTERMVTG